ncbi:hypothetical protein JOL79_11510 [Microbispora sp. RL4-1S]|uniref:Uncharacterized protein n=1 Tax=Microbispora oryzae TaxID=2806554 RepID=A0A941AHT4_9ACTN|nr:hypothetical protein [Microbispora oryzae]MBP2704441.1 hypothetical protein [Microbispora oryzae]
MKLIRALVVGDFWFLVVLPALMLADHAAAGDLVWSLVWAAAFVTGIYVVVGKARAVRQLKVAEAHYAAQGSEPA